VVSQKTEILNDKKVHLIQSIIIIANENEHYKEFKKKLKIAVFVRENRIRLK